MTLSTENPAIPPDPRPGDNRAERRRRLRGRNLATLAVLLGLVVLFYVITLTRMGGL